MLKRIVTCTTIYDPDTEEDPNVDTLASITPAFKECLHSFLEYCSNKNLDNIVFVNFPHHLLNGKQNGMISRIDEAESIIAQYGYPFLNLQDHVEEIGIDFDKDFYNTQHLNVYGQQKLTAYLSNRIIHDYHVVPMEQSDRNREQWEACKNETEKYMQIGEYYLQRGEKVWLGIGRSDLPALQELN